jgi:hypothetical protein
LVPVHILVQDGDLAVGLGLRVAWRDVGADEAAASCYEKLIQMAAEAIVDSSEILSFLSNAKTQEPSSCVTDLVM